MVRPGKAPSSLELDWAVGRLGVSCLGRPAQRPGLGIHSHTDEDDDEDDDDYDEDDDYDLAVSSRADSQV